MLSNIVYDDYTKKSDIHGTVLYPASMIAPMQNEVLTELINKNNITSVFDPFHGSGTALYETMMIDKKIKLFGCDINPLANLITRVKLNGISEDISDSFTKLKNKIEYPEKIEKISFPKAEKWFRKDIFESIQIIRSAIKSITNDKDRQFFWVIFCDYIRKYSNTRSSTYKLHIKEEEKIGELRNNIKHDYINAIENSIEKYNLHTNNYTLYKQDVLDLLEEIPDNCFDITISSPPYGDNATTVPYGQFSMLDLHIIDEKDLELEGWELENYSIIDRHSIGGKKKENIMDTFEKQLISPYTRKISSKKREKVYRFFNDYFLWLRGICDVTNEYIVLTLGNRTVDGVKINLTEITKLFLEKKGFKNIEFAERNIPYKRIPKTTSMVNSQPVSSMNKEYMIVHKRIKECVIKSL